ncbi:MAG: DUF72 domain-containing protein [Polyangiaceae bacterium]|jgi:uncharacterized protein YecE (DUF72 family)
MITIGCAGFPVPATRYFKEFLFVEVQDTHVSLPGTGTVRRWRREAPEGFDFSVLAPREIGQDGFRNGQVCEASLKNLVAVAKELSAQIAVFASAPDFTASRANRAAVKEFLTSVRKKFGRLVWEPPPTWDADDAQALAQDCGATVARDPLLCGTTSSVFGYYRLAGPAGHKSRYEDPAIARLAELASAAKNQHAVFLFTNVDMFADAKRLKRALSG